MRKRILPLILSLVLFAGFLVPVSAVNEQDVYSYGGHTYKIFQEHKSWPDAKKACEDLGGHLATITSAEEQEFIVDMKGETSRLWIGAYRDDDFNWYWVTGEKFKYSNWGDGEPNNQGNEKYCAIWPEEWNDLCEDSYEQSGYICEWDMTSSWAQTEVEKAEQIGLIPDILQGSDLTKPITRTEFAAVSVKVFENLSGTKAIPIVNNPFTDTNDIEVLKAYGIGAVNGTSPTTFSPNDLLNREQCATMLTRVFKRVTLAGWTLNTDGMYRLNYIMPAKFADDSDISDYARDSVYFMVSNKIINGVGNNMFAPKNTTSDQEARGYANATREQALAIAVRMVENLH